METTNNIEIKFIQRIFKDSINPRLHHIKSENQILVILELNFFPIYDMNNIFQPEAKPTIKRTVLTINSKKTFSK